MVWGQKAFKFTWHPVLPVFLFLHMFIGTYLVSTKTPTFHFVLPLIVHPVSNPAAGFSLINFIPLP